MLGTEYKFAHRGPHPETGEEVLKWVSGMGDVIERTGLYVPVGSDLERQLVAASPFEHNFLADEGEQQILDVYFRGATPPASFYLRLYNTTPTETSTLAAIAANEVTGTGYAPLALARNSTDWPTLGLNAGDYRVTSAAKTFTAGGVWTDATTMVLATSADSSGKLVAARALSATRTLQPGDTLQITYSLTLS